MNLFPALLRLSLTNPTAAGQMLVNLRLTLSTALSAFALVIIAAVLIMFGLSGFQGMAVLPGFVPLSPWALTALMGGGTFGLVCCIWLISRALAKMGGSPMGCWYLPGSKCCKFCCISLRQC